jgi:hypothetical protein
MAEETIRGIDASGHWPGKVTTEISEAGPPLGRPGLLPAASGRLRAPFPRQAAEATKR